MQLATKVCIIVAGILLNCANALGQRINFRTFTTDNITLTVIDDNFLDFNERQPIILPGQTVSIALADAPVTIVRLDARADLDVTITITADPFLTLNPTNQIPLAISFAYSNRGAITPAAARSQAVVVPGGFTQVRFPVTRRATGPPGPPPTPDHPGHTQPMATAYLFIFGTIGPVPTNAAVGVYLGNINILAEYSD